MKVKTKRLILAFLLSALLFFVGTPRVNANTDTVSAKMRQDPAFAAEMIRSFGPQMVQNQVPVFGTMATLGAAYTLYRFAPPAIQQLKNKAIEMFMRGTLTAKAFRDFISPGWHVIEVINQAPKPAGDWLVRNNTWTYPTVDGDYFSIGNAQYFSQPNWSNIDTLSWEANIAPGWDQLTPEQKQQGLNNVPPADWADAVAGSPAIPNTGDNTQAPGIPLTTPIVNLGNPGQIIPLSDVLNAAPPVLAPVPTPLPTTSPTPTPAPTPAPADPPAVNPDPPGALAPIAPGDRPGALNPAQPGQCEQYVEGVICLDPSPINSPTPTPNPNPSSIVLPIPNPNLPDNITVTADSGPPCPDCQDRFSTLNFYRYLLEKLENKFPFDIKGILPSGDTACPRIEAYRRHKELCIVRDALGYFKFPVWISFLIRMVLSL